LFLIKIAEKCIRENISFIFLDITGETQDDAGKTLETQETKHFIYRNDASFGQKGLKNFSKMGHPNVGGCCLRISYD
jgi:hypothetical protein